MQFDHSVRALAKCQGPIQGKLRRLKQCIIEGMVRAARHRVAQKVETEGWAGGISFTWLLRLSGIKKGWCFFFYCVAELAVKPCRSSRSKMRGGFEKIP